MTSHEVKIMQKLLPELLEMGQNSTICKVFGIYTFKLNLTNVHVMLMKNSLLLTNPENVMTHIFDLKGSKVNRKVMPRDLKRSQVKSFCKGKILKCQDLKYLLKFIKPNMIHLTIESR